MHHSIVFTDMYKYLCNQVTEVMDFDNMWHIRFNLTKQIVKTIGKFNLKLLLQQL